MPFAFMMGVDWQDSFMVAKLIGYKTFFNEFVAYEKLSKLIHLRQEGGPKFVDGVQQYMSVSKFFPPIYFFVTHIHSSNSCWCLCVSGTMPGIWGTSEGNRPKISDIIMYIVTHNCQLC